MWGLLRCSLYMMMLQSIAAIWCGTNIPKVELIESLYNMIPRSDGSYMEDIYEDPNDKMLGVITSNFNAMGLKIICVDGMCDIAPQSEDSKKICSRVFVAAIMGNFLHNNLEVEDAIAHLRLDVSTGLLTRKYNTNLSRFLFADVLLILAVVLLAKRAIDDQGKK